MSIIDELKSKENTAIIEGLAMMSYVLSIGRVFEKGGVDKFIEIALNQNPKLKEIKTQKEFDNFHNECINQIIKTIRTAKGKWASYGQAQKPLNVFLKVFIDWTRRAENTDDLRALLHVPLDSILMNEIKNKYPGEFKGFVEDRYCEIRKTFKDNYESKVAKTTDAEMHTIINSNNFKLERIFLKDMYYAWQNCLRAIYPERPVLLDVLWSINRKQMKLWRSQNEKI